MTKQEKYAKQFTDKSGILYGNKYDYSKVTYTRAIDKVIIICPKHGEFSKTPNKHLQGQGCPNCSTEQIRKTKTKPFTEFVSDSNKAHGNKYSYSATGYVGSKVKVSVTCPDHGVFYVSPDKHINHLQGCPKCSKTSTLNKITKTVNEFVTESTTTHNGLYTYSNTVYTGAHNNVLITCPVHGDFEQTPSNHLAGKGCRKCTVTGGGFDSSKAGTLYYISIDDGKYFKIGITNRTVWERFSKDEHHRITIVKEWHYPLGRNAQVAETEVLREHKESIIPLGTKVLRNGNTEILTHDVLGLT